jgi:hypothetical protein
MLLDFNRVSKSYEILHEECKRNTGDQEINGKLILSPPV